MSKEKLLAIIKKILNIDEDLSLRRRLGGDELSELIVLIRHRLDRQPYP